MDRQKPSRSGTELMLDLARLLKAAVRIARAAAVAGLSGFITPTSRVRI